MESAVEVALPADVEASRLMRSPEGFGRGNSSSGGVLGRGRWSTEVALGEFGRKDNVHAIKSADQAFWLKIPDPEICVGETLASLASSDALTGCALSKRNANSSGHEDAKLVLKKSGKLARTQGGYSKRPGIVKLEVSKSKLGLDYANGISPELASSSACSSVSAKHQLVKQKSSLTCGRGDKRSNKVKYKNRSDSCSLKNGVVGFSSPAAGDDFCGMYGLKPGVFDMTKFDDELPLDDLLRGCYTRPSNAKEKEKVASNSNDNLLQSVRKVSSILQARKGLQDQNCGDTDSSNVQVSNGLVTVSYGVAPTDGAGGVRCSVGLPTPAKVRDSDNFSTSVMDDSPLYPPEDILHRLALPPLNISDLLVSDASKTTTSKNSSDSRLGKTASHPTGLPPFPWSHSFPGHNKLGSDSLKVSTSRAICQGRWVKIKNPTALHKGSDDLLVGFESRTFDESLVPLSSLSEHPECGISPVERNSSISLASSSSESPEDEFSPTHIAARTLLDMGACSRQESTEALKLIRKPSQVGMKACKLKALQRTDKVFANSKSRTRPANPSKLGDDGFPPKKLRFSADPESAYAHHAEPVRRRTTQQSASPFLKSPQTRLFKAASALNGANLINKAYMMRPPRVTESSNDSREKFRKVAE